MRHNAGFVAFDTYKALLADEQGNITGPRTVVAGFGAGITESLLAVTPFESIKTQMYVKSDIAGGKAHQYEYLLTANFDLQHRR